MKNVTSNESFFRGHFPHRPVMPGELMLEALAQAAGLLAIASVGETADDKTMYYFGGIDAARFKRPDGQLAFEAELLCTRTALV